MKDYIEERARTLAQYIIENKSTVRDTAKAFNISKSTVHKDVAERIWLIDKELAKLSLEITPVLEIGRTDIITSIIAESDMISYLPDFVTKDLVASGRLCYLDVCDMNIEIWKQLIFHKNKWMSKSLKVFIDHIKEHEFFNQ